MTEPEIEESMSSGYFTNFGIYQICSCSSTLLDSQSTPKVPPHCCQMPSCLLFIAFIIEICLIGHSVCKCSFLCRAGEGPRYLWDKERVNFFGPATHGCPCNRTPTNPVRTQTYTYTPLFPLARLQPTSGAGATLYCIHMDTKAYFTTWFSTCVFCALLLRCFCAFDHTRTNTRTCTRTQARRHVRTQTHASARTHTHTHTHTHTQPGSTL